MKTAKSFLSRRLSKTPLDVTTAPFKTPQAKRLQSSGIAQKLRQRKSINTSISPELAAEVVRTYIIPMFDHKIRAKSNRSRNERLGITIDISNSKGTVAEELSLSSKLYEKLRKSENKNAKLKQEYQEAVQTRNTSEENEQLKIELLNEQSLNKNLLEQIRLLGKESEDQKMSSVFIFHERNTYKKLFEDSSEELKVLRQSLSAEQESSDIRLFSLISLTTQINSNTESLNLSITTLQCFFNTL
jgi:hypothetical protein